MSAGMSSWRRTSSGSEAEMDVLTRQTYHSLYWSLYCAFQPSGTFGGGGPVGGRKSDIVIKLLGLLRKRHRKEEGKVGN